MVFLVTFMTMWALFMDDLSLFMHKVVDEYFAVVTLVFLLIFLVEQTLRSLAQ